ncbi:MAG: hypothetical protein AAF827_18205 [Cyanobacteria bacterium P01_D01_bin.6]
MKSLPAGESESLPLSFALFPISTIQESSHLKIRLARRDRRRFGPRSAIANVRQQQSSRS